MLVHQPASAHTNMVHSLLLTPLPPPLLLLPPPPTHSSNLPSSSPRCMASMRERMALASLLRLLASVARNLMVKQQQAAAVAQLA